MYVEGGSRENLKKGKTEELPRSTPSGPYVLVHSNKLSCFNYKGGGLVVRVWSLRTKVPGGPKFKS